MTVSVIVPAYNAQATIDQTLKALTEQDYSGIYEIIAVDDGSTDQTSQIIRSYSKVKYIHQANAGPAAARNRGAKEAQGQVLAFTDSDCVPHKDWLSKLTQGFGENNIAVVMGSYGIANSHNPLAVCVYKEILFRHENLLSSFPKVFGSYNFCIRKEVFDQVGGFNASYRQASGEDNDLSYKVISAGWRIYFERKALVNHYHTQALSRYLKEQFRHGMWRAQMYLDHPAMAQGDGYTFWKDILEMPWALVSCCAIILSAFGIIGFKQSLVYFLLPFFVFEILFGIKIIMQFFGGIYLGFAMWLRAFARLFGLSTGILSILIKIFRKKN